VHSPVSDSPHLLLTTMKLTQLPLALALLQSVEGYYVCMYQCNPSGTMLDGFCSSSRCSNNPAGICWSGTGSGAFAAESFSVSSLSDCQDYASSMLYGHTRRRALQASGGRSGISANSFRNRQQAWVQGAHDILRALSSCAGAHRRTQDEPNITRPLTGGQLSAIMEMHLAGKVALDVDVETSNLFKPATHGTSQAIVQSNRRHLLDCVDSHECNQCITDARDPDAWIFTSCYWNRGGFCQASSSGNVIGSSADCPGAGAGACTVSRVRHDLNQATARWVLEECEQAACTYISGGCSPCCSVLSRVLKSTVNDWLAQKADQVVTRLEDEALAFVTTRIFS